MKRILNVLALVALLVFSTQASAQTQTTPTEKDPAEIEQLRQQLTEQQAQIKKLEEKLDAMSSTPGTSAAAAAVPAKSEPTAVAAKPETKPTVESGTGSIKVNGLLQGWFLAGNEGTRDTFRVRRAEFKLTGIITPKFKWTLMIDPSKALAVNNTYTTIDGKQVVKDTSINQAGRILQDAFVTYTANSHVNVNVGQFKVPLSLEGLQSSAALETVERALFITDRARGGAFGDVRDLGVMAHGSLNKQVDYQIGVFNGSGENINDTDKNDQKAVAGRFVVRPSFVRGLQLGASGATSGVGSRGDRPRRDRIGGEMLFVRRQFHFKAEYMSGVDGEIHRSGYYTHFGYKVSPKVELVGRFDTFDPDHRADSNALNVTERDYIGGVNYYITENKVKLQFNYIRKTFADGISPARNVFTVNLQTSW